MTHQCRLASSLWCDAPMQCIIFECRDTRQIFSKEWYD